MSRGLKGAMRAARWFRRRCVGSEHCRDIRQDSDEGDLMTGDRISVSIVRFVCRGWLGVLSAVTEKSLAPRLTAGPQGGHSCR